jgi:hypothetical protein
MERSCAEYYLLFVVSSLCDLVVWHGLHGCFPLPQPSLSAEQKKDRFNTVSLRFRGCQKWDRSANRPCKDMGSLECVSMIDHAGTSPAVPDDAVEVFTGYDDRF